jgi:hypothetical protein
MNPKWFHGYYWLILFSLILYVPLIFLGGFGTSDDLSLVAHIGTDYWQDLKYSLSRSGHVSRPIYGLIQTTTLHLFGSSYVLYNIFRLSLWAALIITANLVFKKSLGSKKTLLFLFFLSFPIFASSQLFNAMQTGYILSIIFFLLALRSTQNQNRKGTFRFYFIYFSWSLLALLSCEIVFPLFLFPLLQLWSNSKSIVRFRNILFTTGLVFIAVLILKFVIGPYYQIGEEIYGFSLSQHSILQGFYYFFAMFIELPILLYEVIPFYVSEPLLWMSLLVFPLVYCSNLASNTKWDKRTFLHALITIFACCFIFVLSNYPAVTYGLYNKMLLPSHLFMSLVLALVCIWLLNSRFYLLSYVIAILWFASMEMQVINTIRSWDKRTEVYEDLVPLLEKQNTLDYVFVEVPYFLTSNYNNEPVFSLFEDFQGGLILNGYKGEAELIFPYTARMLEDSLYWPNHNIVNVIREQEIDNFSCIYTSVASSKYFDSIVDYNNDLAGFMASDYFSTQIDCQRARLRSWLSKNIK